MRASGYWPVNSAGEVVMKSGTGGFTIAAYMPNDIVPTDDTTGAVVFRFPGSFIDVVSASAPSNSDGRPDGTIYLQTA